MPQLTRIDQLHAVVVGSGGIAAALIEQLLDYSGLERIYNLQRSGAALFSHPKLETIFAEATDDTSIESAAEKVRRHTDHIHLLFNTVGVLHDDSLQPEKRLLDVSSENLLQSFTVNALVAPSLARAFSKMLKHSDAAVFASLSARVGSIADNNLGGWYSYRASKAAHNMLIRTLSNEWRLSHRNVSVVALHPGTVRTPLSKPFISPGYKNPVLEPEHAAKALLEVIDNIELGASGLFMDWKGATIDW